MLALILWGIIFVILFWYVAIRPLNYWAKKGVKQGTPIWLVGDNLGTLLRYESFAELVERVYTRFHKYRYVFRLQYLL